MQDGAQLSGGAVARVTIRTLREHRIRQATERLAAGSAWTDAGLVLASEVGTLLEPRNVLRHFQVVARQIGLDGVSLHTLRHTAASFLLAAGVHVKVGSEHLGHSSYAITADVYSHVTPSQAREAADRLDAALDW
jgi:integrase